MKKYMRALLIVPASLALAAVLYLHTGSVEPGPSTDSQECSIMDNGAGMDTTAAQCGRCGDGHCVPQCGENELTCPADCGSVSM